MEDEDLLLRIKNLSSALNNLSDSDEELFAEQNVPEREDVTESERKEEALEHKLRDVIEEFFDICDDDKDGYIFDDDAEIFRDRIRVHPKESFRPLLLWLKSMPHNTIRNTSRAMFIEDVFAAFDQCHADDPEKSITVVQTLIKMVQESIELEKKSNQGHSDNEYEQSSDFENYDENDNDYSREVDMEPTAEAKKDKADPGKQVISKAEKKKDPTRAKTSIPEKGLDWKPAKKAFKAKKRKRKNASKITPVAPIMRERKPGPRDIGVDTDYKPYVPKPQKKTHKRTKRTPSLKKDPTKGMAMPRRQKAPQYHAKSMSNVYEQRGLRKNSELDNMPSHFRARSLGPREIGIARGYKPASYDWSSSLPGAVDKIYPPRIPKARLIQESERPRKTGPREESYPEGWQPPPKEWENTLWRPFSSRAFMLHLSASSRRRSNSKKTKVRRAQTVSTFNTNPRMHKARKKDPVKHERAKTVDFNLGAFSSEPIVIQRKKKKVELSEAGAAEPVSLKPRERAPLEDVFSNDLNDMASSDLGEDVGELDNAEDDGETSI